MLSLDTILTANGVVDEANKLKKELLIFKVYFEEAHNYVNWKYLESVMEKMNFPVLWLK